MKRGQKQTGFTIVELLIVIVVIAILAAISVVAYNGIQQRARDSQRKNDIGVLAKAIELFYADTGRYPMGASGVGWCTQISHPTYQSAFNAAMAPYIDNVPTDPKYSGTSKGYFYRKINDNSYYLYAELESEDRADDGFAGCTRIDSTNNEYDYRYPSF